MKNYDVLLEWIERYKNEHLYEGIDHLILLKKEDHDYYAGIEEDGSLSLYEGYEQAMTSLENRRYETPDHETCISAYMCFIDTLQEPMFDGLNYEHDLEEDYKTKDVSAIHLQEGAYPRFVNETEALLLKDLLSQLHEALSLIHEEELQDIANEQYYLYDEKTRILSLDDFPEREPEVREQSPAKKEYLDLLKEKSREGTWYVYFMYLPIREKGTKGFPMELVLFSKEKKDYLGNLVIGYEKHHEIYATFISQAVKDQTLPEHLIIGDRKTLAYLLPFIQMFNIEYSLSNDPFFKQCYEYYDVLLESVNEKEKNQTEA